MKKFYSILLAALSFSCLAQAQTKTWNGPAFGSWNVAGNWTPAGVPAATDVVIFNNGAANEVTDVPGGSIRGLQVIDNSTVTLVATANIVIDISGPGGTDNLLVETGSALLLNAGGNSLALGLSRSTAPGQSQGLVNGTIVVGANSTLELNNNNTGSIIYGRIENTGGTVIGTNARLRFESGAVYSHEMDAGVVPTATWAAGSRLDLVGTSTTLPTGMNQQFQDIELAFSPAVNLGLAGNLNCNGNMTVNLDPLATGIFSLTTIANNRSITVDGDFVMNSGNFWIDNGNGGSQLRLNGNFIMNGGSLSNGPTNSGTIIFQGTGVQQFIRNGGSISGNINATIDGNSTVDFGTAIWEGTGNFSMNSAGKIITSHPQGLNSTGSQGTVQNTGNRTFNGNADYEFRGATTGVFNTTAGGGNNVRNFTINNIGGEVVLSKPFTVNNTLTLENGYLTSDAINLLTLVSGADAVSNNGAFVNGPLAKIQSNNTSFGFPVGKAGFGLRSISLTGIGGSGTNTFVAEFYRGNPNTDIANGSVLAPGLARVSACEYWTLDRTGGGSKSGIVTLNWEAGSNCALSNYVDNLGTLTVARHDGNSWTNAGVSAVSGTAAAGTISSNSVSSFSPFALASVDINSNPLPVLFADVRAYGKNNGVQVEWSNLTERDVVKYEVERSTNGIDFSVINLQAPKSNRDDKASYDYFDAAPNSQTNYYRIRVQEVDGKVIYSKVLRVEMSGTKATSFSVYPNPVTGKQFTVSLNGLNQGRYQLEVYSANGQRVYQATINNVGAGVTQMVELPASLQTGLYVTVVSGDNYRESRQVLLR